MLLNQLMTFVFAAIAIVGTAATAGATSADGRNGRVNLRHEINLINRSQLLVGGGTGTGNGVRVVPALMTIQSSPPIFHHRFAHTRARTRTSSKKDLIAHHGGSVLFIRGGGGGAESVNKNGRTRCPWPFIFFHDPIAGMKDWQTWLIVGLIVYLVKR